MSQVNGRSKTVYCLALDRPVPAKSLVVGHIFKHEWANFAEEVLGIDVDVGVLAFSLFDRSSALFTAPLTYPSLLAGPRQRAAAFQAN